MTRKIGGVVIRLSWKTPDTLTLEAESGKKTLEIEGSREQVINDLDTSKPFDSQTTEKIKALIKSFK